MVVEAVIFDLDDTLYDERQFVRSGHKAVSSYIAEKYGIDREDFYRLLTSIFSKQGRTNVFDSALKRLSIYEKSIVLDMVKTYRKHHPNIALFRDARKILPEIRKNYRTGLITDGIPGVQKSKVYALKIQNLFDQITYATLFGGKEDVKPFLITLKKLKVKPSESIYIDDNPNKGFTAAKKIGIQTVRILRGPNKNITLADKDQKPEFEIRNLQQLFKVIDTIENEGTSKNIV